MIINCPVCSGQAKSVASEPMAEKPSESRIRVALAQFCVAQSIEIDELLSALGVDMSHTDQNALAHLAGVLDGMNLAASRIRQHGIDNWARDI